MERIHPNKSAGMCIDMCTFISTENIWMFVWGYLPSVHILVEWYIQTNTVQFDILTTIQVQISDNSDGCQFPDTMCI